MNPSNAKLKKSPPQSRSCRQSASQVPSVQWLFRSNIPRRRRSYLAPDIQKRNFFGMGDIIGVLANPAETVRSLTESRKMLEEARREINENKERAQIRPKHTFARLPGFLPRKAEMQAIERAMEGEPSFTVLFGASSVGKTALLREVLTREEYHVLHFDLRIAGFADLPSLYTSLSQQMEQYFEHIAEKMEGYEEFQKEAWSFKHDRLNVERRFSEPSQSDSKMPVIKTSDVARLMELFQSSLLKYWEFQPQLDDKSDSESSDNKIRPPVRRVGTPMENPANATQEGSKSILRWKFKSWGMGKGKRGRRESRNGEQLASGEPTSPTANEKPIKEKPLKKMPVIFFDEAHKLPALIKSTDAMKCLLDSMLVLTKQDRLCHVIHATSDPFYQTWLRQLNIMQHCKIITIGDCSKAETRKFFRERMLPRVPERIRNGIHFEVLYGAFGGKLAHWHDYITDYVNSNGTLDIKQSSHFLQAHSLLNLHIIHSSQAPTVAAPHTEGDTATNAANANPPPGPANTSTVESLHPALGPAGFKIYTPLANLHPASMLSGETLSSSGFNINAPPDFSAMELLKVMSRLARREAQPGQGHIPASVDYIPYFHLCREIGVRSVDGMIRGKVLDLRWTEPVTMEGGLEGRARSSVVPPRHFTNPQVRDSTASANGPIPANPNVVNARGIPVDLGPPPPIDDEEDMVPISESEVHRMRQTHGHHRQSVLGVDVFEEVMEVVGPKLIPMTPIMRYAMRDVVQEYEDDQSISEYASLSDVDEY